MKIKDASGNVIGNISIQSDNYSTLSSSPILMGYSKYFSDYVCHEIESSYSYFLLQKEIDFNVFTLGDVDGDKDKLLE